MHGNIELQEYLPLLVDISLYGANEDTYYKVTGIHGAFNRVLMNCKKLKEAGIRVALKTPVLNETLGQIDEMKSIATKMGIPFVYTFEICPTIDKDVSPKSHQVNMVDALRYEFENHFEQVKNFEKSDLDRNNIIQELLNNDHVYRCNVALNCFTVQRIQNLNGSDTKTVVIISKLKSDCSIRDVPIRDRLFSIMRNYQKAPNTYILTEMKNLYVEPQTMQYQFKATIKKAGILSANFYALRHTFATRCMQIKQMKGLDEGFTK